MPHTLVAHDVGSNELMFEQTDIAIAIISYQLRPTLDEILQILCARTNYPIYLICTAGPGIQRPCIPGVIVLTTPCPMQIGEARVFAAQMIAASYLAFLDDDCIPGPSWLDSLAACISEKPSAAMFFGPRHEVSCGSTAGWVRIIESDSSHKRLLLHRKQGETTVPITAHGPTCAGGNMVINCNQIPADELFDPAFSGCGFEDIDLQLRLLKGGFAIFFVPGLGVRHQDPLSIRQLLSKSLKSGRGISLSQLKHGDHFRRISRWSSRVALVRTFMLCWIWLPAAIAAPPLVLLIMLPVVEAFLSYRNSRNLWSVVAWVTIKPIRDLCILVSAILADIRAAQRGPISDEQSNK